MRGNREGGVVGGGAISDRALIIFEDELGDVFKDYICKSDKIGIFHYKNDVIKLTHALY